MFSQAAISEELCLVNLPQELSLEIVQSGKSVVQLEEVVNMLQKSGRKVVVHPDSWAPKLGIHIEETVSNSFVLQYSVSQSLITSRPTMGQSTITLQICCAVLPALKMFCCRFVAPFSNRKTSINLTLMCNFWDVIV